MFSLNVRESLCSPTVNVRTIDIRLVSIKRSLIELVLICHITKLGLLEAVIIFKDYLTHRVELYSLL